MSEHATLLVTTPVVTMFPRSSGGWEIHPPTGGGA